MAKFENQILGFTEIKSKSVKKLSSEEYRDMVNLYGKEAVDNDLLVEMMVLYPEQEGVMDAQGKFITISETEIRAIVDASNKALQEKLGNGLHRAKSWVMGLDEDNYDYITITEDHSMDVSKRMGFSNGKLSVKEINGIPYMHVKAHIIKPSAKIAIKQGLYREISGTIRLDNTTKEISFVSSPALHYAGVFSEDGQNKPLSGNALTEALAEYERIELCKQEIQDELKFALKEQSVENKLHNLIKCGKIYPRDKTFYNNMLIKQSNEDLDRTITMLQLAEPVIKLNHIDTRNHNFMQGVVMSKDFDSVLADLEKGTATIDKLQTKFKGQFAEGEKKPEDDKKEDKAELSEGDKNHFLKLSAMLAEDDIDGAKKMLAELTENNSTAQNPNETSGQVPDNAKLSEKICGLEAKLSEYNANQKKVLKTLGNLVPALEKLNKFVKVDK